ncbi:MAG: hypothetical protein EB075_06570 [Bacteroidetes bacterium]|nr:hypothetical protein [Bacteroidota bacterium]
MIVCHDGVVVGDPVRYVFVYVVVGQPRVVTKVVYRLTFQYAYRSPNAIIKVPLLHGAIEGRRTIEVRYKACIRQQWVCSLVESEPFKIELLREAVE